MTNMLKELEIEITAGLLRRFFSKIKITESCWLWTASTRGGYGSIRLTGGGPHVMAHRVSWLIHCGPIPKGLCVLHDCPRGDNRRFCNPAHLFLGTKSDNNRDRDQKRRFSHKLTEDQVKTIRSITGMTQQIIAEIYGVDQSTISDIRRGKAWTHS